MAASDKWKNLPNWLTIGRVAAVPVVMLLLMFGGGPVISAVAAIIYLAASLTDLADGYLARKYEWVTDLGRFLDPLADKLLNSAALIMLIPLGRAPAWMVFLIIGREIAVTGLRAVAASDGVVISASDLGKRKTVTQDAAIFCLLWHNQLFWANTHAVGTALLWVALIITYWSGYKYFEALYKTILSDKNSTKGG